MKNNFDLTDLRGVMTTSEIKFGFHCRKCKKCRRINLTGDRRESLINKFKLIGLL